jgi:hypothetical protein
MKVLFLDIDGVLNATEDWIEWKVLGHSTNYSFEMLSRPKIAMLVNIVQKTGCKLVLSSSWRLHYTNEQMIEMFKVRGCHYITTDILIDQTPFPRLSGMRGQEINEWLQEHPEVTQYIILDDSTDFYDHQRVYHVKTDTYVGLTFYQMKECIRLLSDQTLTEIEDDIFNPPITPRS